MPEAVKSAQAKNGAAAADGRLPGRLEEPHFRSTAETLAPGTEEVSRTKLVADPRLRSKSGDGERRRLLLYLQRTHGNFHVAQVVARMQPRPRLHDSVAVQRQATACPAPPAAPSYTSPDQDPKFTAVEAKLKRKGQALKHHRPAKAEANEAQAAAVPPANDTQSQAKAAQAEKMGTAKPGAFNKAAFIAAVGKAIADASPKTLDEADKFASSGKAGQVKNQVMDKVTKGKEDSAKDIKEKSDEPPDPSKATPKPVTPMTPQTPGHKPTDPGATKAMPAPAPKDQTELGAGSCETNAKMAEAGVTEEHLEKSNEPDFQAAVEAKKAGEEHSARAPAEFRAEEQQQLESARKGAATETRASLSSMHEGRTNATGRVGGNKSTAKTEDESIRTEVSTHIEGIYNTTKTEVDRILNGLDAKVSDAFGKGEAEARRAFEKKHETDMEKWKDERYAGVEGAAQWAIDLFKDPPPEVNRIYQRARDHYLKKMDKVISDIADLVGGELTKAKNRIAKGRDDIRRYVTGLGPELRAIGAEAQQGIASKFDELERDVDSKQDALANDLAQKYVEARNEVDKHIEEMQEENKGLWSKASEAVGGALDAIAKLKDLLMSTLARAAGAFTKILDDPIGFIGNFMNAVKSGFMNFATNILTHLKKGLMGWLFGALAQAGIEMPESFNLKGILKMVASILGLTWNAIKARIMRIFPWARRVMGFIESKVEVVVAFVKDGVAGVWNWIKDRLSDLKEMILTPVKEFVVEKIVKAGITWILGMLNPAGALIKVVQALIGVVQWIMERGAQLASLVRTVVDAVSDIAHGGAGGVPAKIEVSLGNAVPIVISFLANLLGLGGISDKIRSILVAVQKPVGKAIDLVIGGAVKATKPLLSKMRGFGAKVKARILGGDDSPEGKRERLDKGLHGAVSAAERFRDRPIAASILRPILSAIRLRHGLVKLDPVPEGDHWAIEGAINPTQKASTPAKLSSTQYKRSEIVCGDYSANALAARDRDKKCQYCQVNDAETADHIIAAYDAVAVVGAGMMELENARAQVNAVDNLLGVCRSCNSSKGSRQLGDIPGCWRPRNPTPRAIEAMKTLGTWPW